MEWACQAMASIRSAVAVVIVIVVFVSVTSCTPVRVVVPEVLVVVVEVGCSALAQAEGVGVEDSEPQSITARILVLLGDFLPDRSEILRARVPGEGDARCAATLGVVVRDPADVLARVVVGDLFG